MDKALVMMSLAVLGVVSGLTFAGHRLMPLPQEGHAFKHTLPDDRISAQIVRKYEEKREQAQKSIEKPSRSLKKEEGRKQNHVSGRRTHYLTRYRIRM